MLNYAIQELRREYPATPPERIVNAVGWAARGVLPPKGHVALHQRARDKLRIDLKGQAPPPASA